MSNTTTCLSSTKTKNTTSDTIRELLVTVTIAVIQTLIHLPAKLPQIQRPILTNIIAIRQDIATAVVVPITLSAAMRLSTTLQATMTMMKRHLRADTTTTRLPAKKLISRNAFASTREKRRKRNSWVFTRELAKRLLSMTTGT